MKEKPEKNSRKTIYWHCKHCGSFFKTKVWMSRNRCRSGACRRWMVQITEEEYRKKKGLTE